MFWGYRFTRRWCRFLFINLLIQFRPAIRVTLAFLSANSKINIFKSLSVPKTKKSVLHNFDMLNELIFYIPAEYWFCTYQIAFCAVIHVYESFAQFCGSDIVCLWCQLPHHYVFSYISQSLSFLPSFLPLSKLKCLLYTIGKSVVHRMGHVMASIRHHVGRRW